MKKLLFILILGLIISGPTAFGVTAVYAGGTSQGDQGLDDDCQGQENGSTCAPEHPQHH